MAVSHKPCGPNNVFQKNDFLNIYFSHSLIIFGIVKIVSDNVFAVTKVTLLTAVKARAVIKI